MYIFKNNMWRAPNSEMIDNNQVFTLADIFWVTLFDETINKIFSSIIIVHN